MSRTGKFYNTHGELIPEDSIFMSGNYVHPDDLKLIYQLKDEFIFNIGEALDCSGCDMLGYFNYLRMDYEVYDSYGYGVEEFVIIYHDLDPEPVATVINVTGDSIEAMLRDIMRAAMRGD